MVKGNTSTIDALTITTQPLKRKNVDIFFMILGDEITNRRFLPQYPTQEYHKTMMIHFPL